MLFHQPACARLASIVEVWSIALIRIVLIHSLIVVIVHSLGMLSGSLLSLIGVVFVHSLCLGELVDFTSNETGEEFFGKGMGHGLACPWSVLPTSRDTAGDGHTLLPLMVFEQFHAFKGSTASDEFMGELGLVIVAV